MSESIETTFDHTLEREDGDITVTVCATGEVDHRDPSVGIFHDGIGYVTIDSVTDENDNTVSLSTYESGVIEREAHEKLLKELDSQAV